MGVRIRYKNEKARALAEKAEEVKEKNPKRAERLTNRAARVAKRKADGPSKKKDDISIDPKNEGKFTKWVEKNMPGKSTCSAASAVMKSKKKYSSSVVKMANYANNFGCKK